MVSAGMIPGQVSLNIYGLSGEKVKELDNSFRPAGNYSVLWDGTDVSGNRLKPGLYLCRMSSGTASKVEKIVIL